MSWIESIFLTPNGIMVVGTLMVGSGKESLMNIQNKKSVLDSTPLAWLFYQIKVHKSIIIELLELCIIAVLTMIMIFQIAVIYIQQQEINQLKEQFKVGEVITWNS